MLFFLVSRNLLHYGYFNNIITHTLQSLRLKIKHCKLLQKDDCVHYDNFIKN